MNKNTLITLSLLAFSACGIQQPKDENGEPSDGVVETDAPYDDEVIGDVTADAGIEADADVLAEEMEPEVDVAETETEESAPEPRTEAESPVEGTDTHVAETEPTTPVVDTVEGTVVIPPPAPVTLRKAPLVVTGTKILLAAEYLGNAGCAELRGDLDFVSWTSGPRAANVNGYYEFDLPTSAASTLRSAPYRFSYVSVNCATGAQIDWALYGVKDVLTELSNEALAPIICEKTSCQNPGSCSLGLKGTGTTFIPAGNMPAATDC